MNDPMSVGQGIIIACMLGAILGILWTVMRIAARILGTLKAINSGLGMIHATMALRAGGAFPVNLSVRHVRLTKTPPTDDK